MHVLSKPLSNTYFARFLLGKQQRTKQANPCAQGAYT